MNGASPLLWVPLGPSNTVPVAHVRHRLALGVQWIDALSDAPVGSGWATQLLAVGARPLVQRWDRHPRGRHALAHAGRLKRLLAAAAHDKEQNPPATPQDDPTNFLLRAYGESAPAANYTTGNDPRIYVPRRLALTPVQSHGIPTEHTGNIRQAWLWPGAAYPLPGKCSAVRGRVLRGASLASASPVPWVRVVFTRPGANPPDFATEARLGHAHGDDRGEFLAVFGPNAVPGGAALPATLPLHAWVFLPPPAALDPADPLASLPTEVAGTSPLNDLLRGTEVPAGYVRQDAIDLSLPPGRVLAMDAADLLFP